MDDIAAGGAPDDEPGAAAPTSARRRATRRTTEPARPLAEDQVIPGLETEAPPTPARTRRKAAKRAPAAEAPQAPESGEGLPVAPAATRPTKRSRRSAAAPPPEPEILEPAETASLDETTAEEPAPDETAAGEPPEEVPPSGEERPAARLAPSTALLFMAPQPEPARPAEAHPLPEVLPAGEEEPAGRRRGRRDRRGAAAEAPPEVPAAEPEAEVEPGSARARRGRRARVAAEAVAEPVEETAAVPDEDEAEDEFDANGRRRRRRGRRGRGRGRGLEADEAEAGVEPEEGEGGEEGAPSVAEEEPLTRRRRRRRRGGAGAEAEGVGEDGVVTVVRVRPSRDEVQGVSGSTRLEAKRQRRRDGREQRRTRPPILSESEFLARREAVDRVMVVRQRNDRTQVAVLEDGILVEHYVARQSATTMVGNVYLGKVQNVLPSMEAAFVDIGRGRNAVLYAGEVNWDATGLEGRARSIEQALKSGDSVLVQVTKDPIGHKGARLTSHIALSGRHLVYVPNGHASGISRKLSDVERRRLRDALKNLVPEGAGVIVRTAAEGASEEDLARDVKRLQAQWEDIQARAAAGGAPAVLSAEPDLVIRVVRDLFNEDFREVVIQGQDAHDQVEQYLAHVSPDLVSRVRQHAGPTDVFAEWRIDEQILKGLDRRVFLPSGGHLVIDRTEAMTVIDVNTGKYTGAGGNLEETVTRNNLEAAEEIVRQLRLRDVGGIVVIDFIDMVLESNRELVLRRLTECLGRDRTKHQVTEITSLGLVQMTRKRIGQGLLEAFSETCDHCKGRGVLIQTEPVAERPRSNVAEKVRAVAASTRNAGTDGQVRGVAVDDAQAPVSLPEASLADVALAEAGLPDSDLPDPLAGAGDEVIEDVAVDAVEGADEAADFAVDLAATGDLTAQDDESDSSSARRRTRRGSSRRRTRP